MVASGNKQARTAGVWVATKAISSSKRRGLRGNADGVAHRHQVCHKQVYGCIRYNSKESSDIPQRYITKSRQEPTECEKLHIGIGIVITPSESAQSAEAQQNQQE